MKWKDDKEYIELVKDILDIDEFKELKNYKHHGGNRLDHCIRVSYRSYKITKKLKMRYKETARAGLLHDFFLVNNQAIKFTTRLKVLVIHPRIAVENSKKYFEISKLEENIIHSHMFPINLTLPRSIESIIVNLVDDGASIYERFYEFKNKLKKH